MAVGFPVHGPTQIFRIPEFKHLDASVHTVDWVFVVSAALLAPRLRSIYAAEAVQGLVKQKPAVEGTTASASETNGRYIRGYVDDESGLLRRSGAVSG